VSGSLDRRPQLDALLAVVLPGDTVVVWRLDRLGRSIRHLIEVVTELGRTRGGFRSLTEAIDTGTAAGRLLFHIMVSSTPSTSWSSPSWVAGSRPRPSTWPAPPRRSWRSPFPDRELASDQVQ